jgi:hypothetical protein
MQAKVFALSAVLSGEVPPSKRLLALGKNIQYPRINSETVQTTLKDKEGCSGEGY